VPVPANLKRLLAPRSVAFVGGRDAFVAMRQCVRAGFAGPIWGVNPAGRDGGGAAVYPSVEALPGVPDAAFVAVPRERCADVVARLAALGTGGCVVYAAGFAEIDDDGRRLQDRVVAAADGMALVGPNCYGVLNYLDGATLWPDEHGGAPVPRGVALVSQSGNLSLTLTFQERSVPWAYVISTGNQAMLGPGELVEAFCEDARVSAIGLYIEGLSDVPAFSRAAARALARGVPVVALKAGRSTRGAAITLSHTSSLAGADALYDALFERYGIVRVHTLAEMLETLKLLHVSGPIAGPRLASLSSSGAEAALIADQGEPLGLEFPDLSAEQTRRLRDQLDSYTTISNPFDYNTGIWGNRAALERCFTTVLAGDVDAGLLVLDFPSRAVNDRGHWEVSLDAFLAARAATGKPAAVVSTLPELLPADARARAAGAGVAPLQGLEAGLAAIAGAIRYARARARVEGRGVPGAVEARAPIDSPRALDEWTAKRWLAGAGVAVPQGCCVTAEEAPAAAAAIGFPVALKAVGAHLRHKTEAGAVRLDLGSSEAVAREVRAMRARLDAGSGSGPRFLVERMVTDAVAELIVGLQRDAQFGFVLVLGAGGVRVELERDARFVLLPADAADVEAALASLRIAPVLAGWRGGPRADVAAAVEVALALARLARRHADTLVEVDVNPLMVRAQGCGAVAVDALVITGR